MKWTTLTLTALLPFALFAKEIDISSTSETLIENGQESAAKEIIAVEDSSQKWNVTDSLNLKDAGNSPVISSEVATNNTPVDSLEADSLALKNDEGNEEGNEEAGAESEEAEAELEADMAEADSATVDSLQKLTLDMTTAFVPSASRRISAPYGIRTYRMHRGVDMGLCHGEDRTIVAAFTGVVTKVRNQGRRKGYGK